MLIILTENEKTEYKELLNASGASLEEVKEILSSNKCYNDVMIIKEFYDGGMQIELKEWLTVGAFAWIAKYWRILFPMLCSIHQICINAVGELQEWIENRTEQIKNAHKK